MSPLQHPHDLAAVADPRVTAGNSIPLPPDRFHRRHALALLGGAALAALWWAGRGDLGLADRLYELQGHRWAMRDARLTQELLHLLGRRLSILAWAGVLVAWLLSCAHAGLAAWRRPWLYLLSASALGAGSVAWIKSWSNVDCPWDLARYGGTHAYLGLFQARPASWGHAACFPAGHASAGYMWLALYFFLARVRPQWRWRGLAAAVLAGLAFGGAQQARGAHFLSHDLATAMLCWAGALGLHALFWPPSSWRARTGALA